MTEYNGACLCGEVSFTYETEKTAANMCDCEMCCTWSAGPLVMVHGETAPRVKEGAPLKVYDSSEWGQRCFCSNCGTSLFWQAKDGSFYGVSADALEGTENFTLESEIFTDQKAKYHTPDANTHCMTAAEFWKMIEEWNAKKAQ